MRSFSIRDCKVLGWRPSFSAAWPLPAIFQPLSLEHASNVCALDVVKSLEGRPTGRPAPRHPDRPPIYNVAWKTLTYLGVAALIHYLERKATR